MQPTLSHQPIRTPWLEQAVFGLDRWLQRRHGVYEYTTDERCLFRLQRAAAREDVTLSDGTRVASGDPILVLHMWNEHMPAMPSAGPTLGWALQVSRLVDISLRELARYLATNPLLDDVGAIRGDMALGPGEQLARISARFGFEAAKAESDTSGTIHRFGENILIFMLVMAANPAAVRAPVLWRDRKLVYLSRRALERRYAEDGCGRASEGQGQRC